jgi:hypothetical protein
MGFALAPTPKPVAPIVVIPAPVQNVPSGLSAEPVSSTLFAGYVCLVPEITELPPPFFDEPVAPNKPPLASKRGKLTVRTVCPE